MFVALFVIVLLSFPRRIGTDTNPGFQLPRLLPDGVTVVGGVGYHMAHCAGDDLIQQHLRLRGIFPLTGGQDQMQKLSTSAHGRVQFGRQSSSAPSQAASWVGVFFFSFG